MIYVSVAFVLIFCFVIEIFSIIFQLTGLSKEKAKFQVISILTATGFTTKESELITTSKVRRKIAQVIMIFGFVSSAGVVSVVFGTVSTTVFSKSVVEELLLGIFVLLAVIFVYRLPKVRQFMDNTIERIASRALFGKDTNVIVVKDSYDNNVVIAEVYIKFMPDALKNKNLFDSGLSRDYGIIILVVEREKMVMTQVSWDTVLEEGDVVTVFGSMSQINQLFYKDIAK